MKLSKLQETISRLKKAQLRYNRGESEYNDLRKLITKYQNEMEEIRSSKKNLGIEAYSLDIHEEV